MKYKIYYTLVDGSEDFVNVSGDTIDEIRKEAEREVEKRGGINLWSEEE